MTSSVPAATQCSSSMGKSVQELETLTEARRQPEVQEGKAASVALVTDPSPQLHSQKQSPKRNKMCWILLSYQNTQDLGSSEDASLSGRQSTQKTVNGAAEKGSTQKQVNSFRGSRKTGESEEPSWGSGETVHTVNL